MNKNKNNIELNCYRDPSKLEIQTYEELSQKIEKIAFPISMIVCVGELDENREYLGQRLGILQETLDLLEEAQILLESLIPTPTKH